MGVIKKLKEFGKRQSFQPTIFSLFLNPFFFIRIHLFRSIRKYASELNGRLLDFGCGRKPYRNLFEVDEYIGLDLEESGHPHQDESQIDVFYNGKQIPFEDASFDSVFSSEVFEHVFNLDEILSEIYRILKKDGVGLITVPFVWGEHEEPYDYGRYTSFGIMYLLEKNGFEVIHHKKTGHHAEVVIQQFIVYIFTLFSSDNRYLNTLLTIIFISPLNILGTILAFLVPRSKKMYHNNVILFQKK